MASRQTAIPNNFFNNAQSCAILLTRLQSYRRSTSALLRRPYASSTGNSNSALATHHGGTAAAPFSLSRHHPRNKRAPAHAPSIGLVPSGMHGEAMLRPCGTAQSCASVAITDAAKPSDGSGVNAEAVAPTAFAPTADEGFATSASLVTTATNVGLDPGADAVRHFRSTNGASGGLRGADTNVRMPEVPSESTSMDYLASSLPPTPLPSHAGRIPQAMVVLAQAEVPPDCPPGTNLVELLQRLLPEHVPSATAAKRAIRRRLVLRIRPPALPRPEATTDNTEADTTNPASAPSAAAAGQRPHVPQASPSPSPTIITSNHPCNTFIGSKPHPNGVLVSTVDGADPRDVLQLLARAGSGYMGWLGPEADGDAAAQAGSSKRRSNSRRSSSDSSSVLLVEDGAESSEATGSQGLPGLPVAYEDDHLAVVIKPPGIETQGSGPGSVQGRLKYCLRPTPLIGALNRPQQVHRLDLPTGGLLLAAKTCAALRGLAADLHDRQMTKRYCALVKGIRSGTGTINLPLSGKPCVTHYEAVPLRLETPVAAAVTAAEAAPSTTAPGVSLAAKQAASTGTANTQLAVVHAGGVDGAAGAAPVLIPAAFAAAATTAASSSSRSPAVVAAAAPPDGAPAAATATSTTTAAHLPSRRHGALSKVVLWPATGRTHQLRKHMAYTGTPMLGDPRYRAPKSGCGASGLGGSGDGAAGGCDGGEDAGGGALAPSELAMQRLTTSKVASQVGTSVQKADCEEGGEDGGGGDGGKEGGKEGREDAGGGGGGGDWEVYRPPVDAEWVMAAAADAAKVATCAGDVLSDGITPVSLCLWAVGLRFRHPITGRQIEVDITDWANALYDNLLQREAAASAAVVVAATASGAPIGGPIDANHLVSLDTASSAGQGNGRMAVMASGRRHSVAAEPEACWLRRQLCAGAVVVE